MRELGFHRFNPRSDSMVSRCATGHGAVGDDTMLARKLSKVIVGVVIKFAFSLYWD